MNKNCYFCGADKNIVFDIINSNNNYIIVPTCPDCKIQNSKTIKNSIEINKLMQWEQPLKELETNIAKQIVDEYFPDIKFKKDAALKIENLMQKYSIRKVYQACTNQKKNQFNLSAIECNCNAG